MKSASGENMKTCKKCDRTLETHNFWRHGKAKDGLQGCCIECMSKSHSAWRNRMDATYLDRRAIRNKESMDGCRGKDPIKQTLRSIKQRAAIAGLEFDLKPSDLVIPEFCPVLGIPIIFKTKMGYGLVERDQRPSVDRIDNKKGYVRDNIIVVSYRANRIKSDATNQELRDIANFYGRLDEKRGGNSEGCGDRLGEVARRSRENHMSGVQFSAQEEEGSMLERQPPNGRNCMELPPLRAQRRGIL